MFACLCQPSSQPNLFGLPPVPRGSGPGDAGSPGSAPGVSPLEALAREFSPRVEVHGGDLVSLDIVGLGRLLGTPADIAQQLQRSACERGLRLQVAVAPTRTAALLLAIGRHGVTVARPGGERDAVAPIALGILRQLPAGRVRGSGPRLAPGPRSQAPGPEPQALEASEVVSLLQRWGLKTLGDLAALPSRPLSERLGQQGVMWQRLARGEDLQPLLAREAEAPIEETLDLEWPVEGLEPLSFVFARMCEPLAERLAALDLAAVVLHLSFRLVSRDTETRQLQLPAPMRDPKVLRTLILLHLESHPLTAGVDRLSLRVEAAPARVTQFSLLARARPFPEQLATLLGRLSALLGERRVGAPALVDTYRPGAFTMAPFSCGAAVPPAERGPAGRPPWRRPRGRRLRWRRPRWRRRPACDLWQAGGLPHRGGPRHPAGRPPPGAAPLSHACSRPRDREGRSAGAGEHGTSRSRGGRGDRGGRALADVRGVVEGGGRP